MGRGVKTKRETLPEVMRRLEKIREQRDELLAALKEARQVLQAENDDPCGSISDTIWRSGYETLFDFMDAAIAKAS